jgi:hypothetical protein
MGGLALKFFVITKCKLQTQEGDTMISNYFFETEMQTYFESAKNCILNLGALIPTVFIYSDKGLLMMSDFDFSDRPAARQIIRERIACDKADMVVITTEAWVRKDSSVISKDRQQAICGYGETADQNMLIVQIFQFDKNGKVVFGKLEIVKNQYSGALTGYFKP